MKIIQLVLTPNDAVYQGRILGLADNGDTYIDDNKGGWSLFIANVGKNDCEFLGQCAKHSEGKCPNNSDCDEYKRK